MHFLICVIYVFGDVSVPILVHQLEELLCLGLLAHELLVGQPPVRGQLLALQQLLRLVPAQHNNWIGI